MAALSRSRLKQFFWHAGTATLLILLMAQCIIALAASATLASVVDVGLAAADDGPSVVFNYTHLWTSQDGETHIAACEMQNFTLQSYSLLPQYLRTDFGGLPFKMVFTELPSNFTQGLHSPPAVQFVFTLYGSWYVKTTDGSLKTMVNGDVLFQDNTAASPADKVPQHYSGTTDTPCHQFVVQFNRTAQVDNPCPFV